MKHSFPTVFDVLELAKDPATLTIEQIRAALRVSWQSARELRVLAIDHYDRMQNAARMAALSQAEAQTEREDRVMREFACTREAAREFLNLGVAA